MPGQSGRDLSLAKSDGFFIRPTYCWVYVIWWLIGHYYWGGMTAGCPTLSAKGGTTRLQFSPFSARECESSENTHAQWLHGPPHTITIFSRHRATSNSLHSTSIVRTVIYQRDKFVQCYEASSFCFMYLASKVARCNISSNTKETNMQAIASQWLTDHSQYVLPPFQHKCLNFMQTLVQSCTTTKVDTYFGTEIAKEKKQPCSP